MHAGDDVQIRRAVNHPHLGRLPNGTTATVIRADPRPQSLTVRLADGRAAALTAEQLAIADMRLAYVQHPFPAQGQTTDNAHLILAEHATQEGCYVALTRARHQTHIHASEQQLSVDQDADPVASLAERMSRTEPDVPSILTPLAHEHEIANTSERETDWQRSHLRELAGHIQEPHIAPARSETGFARASCVTREAVAADGSVPSADPHRWPREPQLLNAASRSPQLEHDHTVGWEP